MNPYEANPTKIPLTDRFNDVPFYGRYFPQPNDFRPDLQHINSTSPASISYWLSVLSFCDLSVRIYENVDGGRDVFALGTVIVKSTHLKKNLEGRRAERDYSLADANEVEAIALARTVLATFACREFILQARYINGRDVLVQERIPGVGLTVAWQYISQAQKALFKDQARALLRQLQTIKPPAHQGRSCVVPDPDPVRHRGIQELERDILFSDQNNNESDLGLMHNDFSLSNCIVDNDMIVGLVDWEMAGFFSWRTAAEVHVRIRSPKLENFAALNLSEAFLGDILFWNDLYAADP